MKSCHRAQFHHRVPLAITGPISADKLIKTLGMVGRPSARVPTLGISGRGVSYDLKYRTGIIPYLNLPQVEMSEVRGCLITLLCRCISLTQRYQTPPTLLVCVRDVRTDKCFDSRGRSCVALLCPDPPNTPCCLLMPRGGGTGHYLTPFRARFTIISSIER